MAPASRAAPQFELAVEKLAAAGPVIWNPALDSGAPPPLVSLSVAGELATPTGCAGKFRLAGLTDSDGGRRPVPLRETVCPLFRMSATVNDPVCVPDCVGAKETANEQLEWAPRVAVQLLVSWNGPVTVAAIKVRATSPLFVRVTVCGAEFCPMMVRREGQ